ncbi:DUF2079 domain-containing protein [Brevibacterium salitolerans]|uniref:DUF2079 domain-containing protein n=1 Tax=Brevibacterium salitolerans TaxID=1403566 RepID=UPI0031E35E0B
MTTQFSDETTVPAPSGPSRSTRAGARLLRGREPAVASVAAFLLYGALSVIMWRVFYSPSWDLGIFTQMMTRYAEFSVPIVDIKGPGFNLWGDHFHPLLMVLTPLFWIWPSGLTLMLAQAALFAASVWPVVSLASTRLSVRGTWLLAFSYVFSWGLLNAVTAQFHEIALAVPLMAFGLVWWIRDRKLPAAVAIALLVFVKEDLGVTVAVFGLAIWLRNRADLRWAAGLAAWGIAWLVYSVVFFLPAFNTEGQYDYTGNVALADVLAEGLLTKIGTVGFLVLAAGIVGLRSPFALLLLPTLAWRFVGNVEGYWDTSFHYSAVLIPVVAVSLLEGTRRQEREFAPLVAAVAAVALFSQTHLNLLWEADRYRVDGQGAVAAASEYDSVVTDIRLLAYLAPHTDVYWTGSSADAEPEAVALRPDDYGEEIETWAEDRYSGDWTTVYDSGGYQVVVRSAGATAPEAADG